MTLFLIPSEVIGLILGLYGAIASTLIYYFDRRLIIRVRVFNSIIVPSMQDAIQIKAANLSWKRSTTLGNSHLLFPRNVSVAQLIESRDPPDLQYEIGPGSKELTIFYNKIQLIQALKESGFNSWMPFYVILSGPGGEEFRSKKKWLNIESGFVEDRSLKSHLKRMYKKARKTVRGY